MKYLFFMLFLVGTAFGLSILLSNEDSKHPALNDASLKTDYLLKYAKDDISKKYYETSLYHIEKAIEVMQLMEVDTDLESDEAIERAIKDLRIIEAKVHAHELKDDETNFVFAKALNSVTNAHLRLSEKFSEEGQHEKAIKELKLAINHLQNAMLFSTGKYKDLEYHVFNEIDSLIQLEEDDPEKFLVMVKEVILEIDTALLNKELTVDDSYEMMHEEEKEDHSHGGNH